MVTEPAYAPPLSETARNNVRAVVDALIAGTGLTETFVSAFAKGDRAFTKRMPETTMSMRTYDEAMGRLSAGWPSDLPWPEAVPRPEPAGLSEDERRVIDAMIIRRRADMAAKDAKAARQRVKEAQAAARIASQAARASKGAAVICSTAGGEQAPAQT